MVRKKFLATFFFLLRLKFDELSDIKNNKNGKVKLFYDGQVRDG